MCRRTDGLRGPLARRRASIDPRDTRLDVAWMHAVSCKIPVDVLETRARRPKTRVGGRYMETDRCKMDAGWRKMDTDFGKLQASIVKVKPHSDFYPACRQSEPRVITIEQRISPATARDWR